MLRRGWTAIAVALAGMAMLATPASAGHPGEGVLGGSLTASAASASEDMELLANSPNPETTNSDLAFWGDLAYAGNYDGFRILDISDPRNPEVLTDFACRGPQNDVGVWDTGDQRLLFLSIDSRQATEECESGPGSSTGGFEGIRIFDVTDPRNPQFIEGVATDCGSHTHTVVPARKRRNGEYVTDPDNPNRVLIYVSSYPLGPGIHGDDEETEDNSECGLPDPTPHNVESIVEVPFDDPSQAKVINQLFLGPATVGCHDVGVHLGADLAAAACLTEGQIWDISNPAEPVITDRIVNPDIEIWHSGSFTWDAEVAIFGDEEGGAAATHGCNNAVLGQAPGAIWFYDVESPAVPQDSFTQKRGQLDLICTAHNYNVVPGIDRDVLVSSFYSAGTGVIDFTRPFDGLADTSDPREIGFYDAAAGDGGNPEDANTWSTYFYNGLEVANDIDRGVDIFRYLGPETRGATPLDHLNPQTQERFIAAREDEDDDDEDEGDEGSDDSDDDQDREESDDDSDDSDDDDSDD